MKIGYFRRQLHWLPDRKKGRSQGRLTFFFTRDDEYDREGDKLIIKMWVVRRGGGQS